VYKYYQVGEKGQWILITEEADTEQQAIAAGARKLTMLSVSEAIDETTDRADLSYKGPFNADIDNKHDLMEAARSTQALVSKLLDLQVPEQAIQVYASGSKGFHVIVPESVFSSGRALKNLPAIYKEMALELYVLGMDFQVYSGGRGTCWRLPNIQRDNGKYRVPITLEELFSFKEHHYDQFVSNPRILPAPVIDPSERAHGMEALMERAKKKVRAKPAQPEPIADDRLAEFKEEPPACVVDLADYKVKASRNFNEVALQFGIFLARSGMEDTASSSLISRLASNGSSQSYSTPRSREDHLTGLVGYLNYTPSKKFSCAAMRSVIATRPCPDCSLCKAGEEEAEVGEDLGLVERSDGYYILSPNGDRRISTFILKATNVFLEQSQSGKSVRRVGATVEIVRNDEILGKASFSEQGWVSKSTFKGELKGIGNLAFYGSEDDIQRIKHITLDEDQEMGEIVQVKSAGMHTHRLAGKNIRVYVEPGFSINQYRVRGTHSLTDRVTAPPSIHTTELPTDGDGAVSETLLNLFRVNTPYAVAQILGWTVACHLKTHLMERYSQFPLLSLWGNAGAGKSMTSTLFAWLNGCNYSLHDSPVSMSSITPWAMIRYCSSSTTVPRILEEYNKSKISIRKYDQLGEIMKMSWNGQMIARGTIKKSSVEGGGGGAHVEETPICAPLLIVSEQAPQMPALQQRSVQVKLNPQDIHGREDHFFQTVAEEDHLRQVSKALVFSALKTDIAWVEKAMEHANALLPPILTDRPRYSYQVLVMGLMFMRKVCTDLNLHHTVDEALFGLETELLSHITEKAVEISRDKMRTEADLVMEDIGLMAQMTINGGATWISSPAHYTIRNNVIYFDLAVMFATYKQYKTASREKLIIENSSQFKQLVAQEPYFVTDQSIDGASALRITRAVLELDMEKMQEKGLDVTMYG
jgi:hypothetical protein